MRQEDDSLVLPRLWNWCLPNTCRRSWARQLGMELMPCVVATVKIVVDRTWISHWSASKRLMDVGSQRFLNSLAFSLMETLLQMQCQKLRYWRFVLLPTGLKMATQSPWISAYRSLSAHESLALCKSQKGVGCSPVDRMAYKAPVRLSQNSCSWWIPRFCFCISWWWGDRPQNVISHCKEHRSTAEAPVRSVREI